MTAGESPGSWPSHLSPVSVPYGFESFFRKTFPVLVRLLSVGADDVDDAVQEAFLEAHLRWEQVSRYDDPGAWVRRVAIRRLQNRQRGRGRALRAVSRIGLAGEISSPSGADVDLVSAIRRLPPRQRMAVALYYYADSAIQDVADSMGVTTGTVKASLHAARAQLRAEMEDRDGS